MSSTTNAALPAPGGYGRAVPTFKYKARSPPFE
jgi:hypothetical protein